MKNRSKYLLTAVLAGLSLQTFAGNQDRVGSAGATELLFNPWTRSSAMGDAGVASVTGIESMFMNIAGLALLKKTELGFIHTKLYGFNDGVNVNTIGFGQRVGEQSVIGLSFNSFNFGDIPVTTTENPEGLGTFFSPRYVNLGFSYARAFSNSIYGGITVRVINESISNAKATGVAFDAGIKYVTGEKDQIKFGINLKNVGPPMTFSGDGFSVTSVFNASTSANNISLTTEQRSAKFELPSQVNVAFSYDFLFGETSKLTAAAAYTSNSFSKDNYRLGLEYTYTVKKAVFGARAGLAYEDGMFNTTDRTTAFTGPSGGISVDFGKDAKESTLIGLEYTYRASSPLAATHSIGVRINLR